MDLLRRLERRFGRYAVPNVTLVLILGQAFVYLAASAPGGAQLDRLQLVPALVLKGEVWRLFTYPLTPPPLSPIVLLIYLMAFYYFGTAVESIWGAFRYNAYLLLGFTLTAAAAFVEPNWPASSHYVKTSVFLAYAALLPNAVIHIYMILPVKARYLAALTWALYAYSAWFGGLSTRLTILAAVANFFLFFAYSSLQGLRQARRRRGFRRKVAEGNKPVTHECRVCGLTSEMAPKTAFRYCSKCAGQCCYCPEHIKDHECVVVEENGA